MHDKKEGSRDFLDIETGKEKLESQISRYRDEVSTLKRLLAPIKEGVPFSSRMKKILKESLAKVQDSLNQSLHEFNLKMTPELKIGLDLYKRLSDSRIIALADLDRLTEILERPERFSGPQLFELAGKLDDLEQKLDEYDRILGDVVRH